MNNYTNHKANRNLKMVYPIRHPSTDFIPVIKVLKCEWCLHYNIHVLKASKNAMGQPTDSLINIYHEKIISDLTLETFCPPQWSTLLDLSFLERWISIINYFYIFYKSRLSFWRFSFCRAAHFTLSVTYLVQNRRMCILS